MKRRVCTAVLLTVLLVGSLYIVQRLVMPKYMTEIPEGALIAEYYNEKVKEHDVLLIGDCEVYENVSPITLWEEYGITSYIRGSAQQLIWQTYYLLEDSLRYETPDVFVYNVLSMKYDEPQSEAYNRMSIDGMRLSWSKIRSVVASMTEEEELLTYLFPILRYHTRWSELTKEDFRYLFHRDTISHNGYLMQKEVRPLEVVPKGKKLPDYQFSDICYDYLDRMRILCEENDVQMVLMKAPSVYPYWYREWDDQMKAYAEEHNLIYINYLDCYEQVGIDFATDTYDAGLHLNVYGAEKLSKHLGKVLSEECGVQDHREDTEYQEIWGEKTERYYAERGGRSPEQESIRNPDEAVKDETNAAVGENSNPAMEQENDAKEWYFANNGVKFVPGADSAVFKNALGKPNFLFEAESCAFEGMDRIYSYDGFEIYTADDGEEKITSILIVDDSVKTVEGIYLGETVDKMIALYGEADEQNFETYTYYRGNSLLIFMFEDGELVSVEYSLRK